MEIWKVLPEKYPGVYLVSNFGRIRSFSALRKGSFLTPCINSSGYLHITGKNKTLKMHQLVMDTFIGPRPKGYEVNHIDGNKLNNRLNNLEYITKRQNLEHATKMGLFNKKLTPKQVLEMRKIREHQNMAFEKIGRLFGVSRKTASRAIKKELHVFVGT